MSNIRYAQIRELDISNGEGVGISLFVQGCHFRCQGCFNTDTWDFNGGKEWTQEVENKFLELASRPYIKRISILGGEPLAEENLEGVLHLVNEIRDLFPEKTIWLYTGYLWEELFIYENDKIRKEINLRKDVYEIYERRKNIVKQCDVLVDGRYIDVLRDIGFWRGSKNQRVIDIQQSLRKGYIILWNTD